MCGVIGDDECQEQAAGFFIEHLEDRQLTGGAHAGGEGEGGAVGEASGDARDAGCGDGERGEGGALRNG